MRAHFPAKFLGWSPKRQKSWARAPVVFEDLTT